MRVMTKRKKQEFKKLNAVFKDSNKYFLLFFFFKLFLLFLYFLGSFQSFTQVSTRMILRVVLSNDIFIIFFGAVNIAMIFINKESKGMVFILINSTVNILFAFVTVFLSFTILVLT